MIGGDVSWTVCDRATKARKSAGGSGDAHSSTAATYTLLNATSVLVKNFIVTYTEAQMDIGTCRAKLSVVSDDPSRQD